MKERLKELDGLDILKYGMVFVILIYIIVLLVREGGDAPIAAVKENVLAAVGTESMSEAGTQDLKRYYGLNANDYDGMFLYLPDDVMSVNELLVIRLKDKSQAEDVQSAAQKRLDTQRESFEGYGAEQTKLITSAILESRGQYVFLAVGKDADKAYAAFKKSL